MKYNFLSLLLGIGVAVFASLSVPITDAQSNYRILKQKLKKNTLGKKFFLSPTKKEATNSIAEKTRGLF